MTKIENKHRNLMHKWAQKREESAKRDSDQSAKVVSSHIAHNHCSTPPPFQNHMDLSMSPDLLHKPHSISNLSKDNIFWMK